MVGSGWQKIKPWTVQPKQLYPVMSDIEIWGGASFIIIMLVSSGWNALSIYCRIGFLNSQSVPGTCDKKNCECVVQVAFLELYCLPSCVYNQVTAATGGLDDKCGAELPNNTVIKQIWWYTDNLFHLFFRCSMRADTGGWNNLYIIMINRPMSYFVGFMIFPMVFPRFPLMCQPPPTCTHSRAGQRRCGGWFGRGSWQGWRWGPQWWSAHGRGCYLH